MANGDNQSVCMREGGGDVFFHALMNNMPDHNK